MQTVFICLVALAAALFVTLLYCALVVASDADDRMDEIVESKLIIPEVTPVPMPPETWVRYAVNLDDDLQKYITKVCRDYGVSSSVVMAVIETESDCDPYCISDNGHSKGLMQIWEDEHKDRMERLGVTDLLDPKQNILCGVDFLAELMDIHNDAEWALSWYNGHGGDPCEYAYKVLTRAEQLLESCQVMEETND